MAIDSSGSGSGTVSILRDTITSLRGLDTINRINPTAPDQDRPAPEDTVRISDSATTDPRQAEQQQLDDLRQGLSDASATATVALAGAQSVSGTLDEIGSRLRELSDEGLSAERRATLAGEVQQLARQGLEAIEQSSFNGVNLIDDQRDEDLEVVADREGATETIRDQNLRPALENLQELNLDTAESAQAALGGAFEEARTVTDTAVRQLTEDTGRVGDRIAAVQDQQTDLAATDEGVDTRLDAEGAQSTAAQLSTQLQAALDGENFGVVNQRPATLSGLFR